MLVAGHGTPGGATLDASVVHTLGQVGEALLATGAQWQIRRLTATAGDRYAADRGTLKRHIDELAADPTRVAVLVVAGQIVEVGGEHALVTGAQPELYPEESTLPLAWLRDRLRASKAEQVVVVVSAHGAGTVSEWLAALRTGRASHLISVGGSQANLDALLSGLCGEALDPRTGTVTMASLAAHLAGASPVGAIQSSEVVETIAQPPPLAGLWDVRRSQLSQRGPRRLVGASDDLTGTVQPGRFRVDGILARGTFGTVYRARQLAVERDVALKVLHAEIDPSSEDGRLFVHEIRSVGRLDHANIVRIHQADITHDGRLFFAMELLGGGDLQSIGKVPQARAVALVRQLLAGLAAAHDAGLVHADIKPANAILVERDGAERVVLVDFGLSRLRAPDRPAESAGGTPAYMAPEQLHEGRVDARSDLYSAALVLVYLLTGWQRPNVATLSPPLDTIEDRALRAVLAKALATDPAQRYESARELSSALAEEAPPEREPPPSRSPFRHLAPLTEADRDRLFGREADVAALTEHALYRRSVIYTAPSGVGKTSLLRAGLVPRLEALGITAMYVRCRGSTAASLSQTITEHGARGRKLVLILDQLESALELVDQVLDFSRWPADADVSVVLAVREDHLARLVARTQELEPGIPIVRLPPLSPDGARDAITGPLAEARLAIEPELLTALLADLERAAVALWSGTPAVYPPHLQLACTSLCEALAPGAATLTLADYRRLGGFDAIVGEYLERVLDTELADGRDVIARDLFVSLVTTSNERAMRAESELVRIASARHEAHEVRAVLEALRTRGLVMRVRDSSGEPAWELVHDSLVPRVLAWLDRVDLDRRRAVELVRYHLRRSRPGAPSLLSRAELRELAPYAAAIAELDEEWRRRTDAPPADDDWTPTRLVERSKQAQRRRVATIASALVASLSIASVGFYRSHVERMNSAYEESLRTRDLGRFVLSLEPFDWDPTTRAASRVAPSSSTAFAWELHLPADDDPASPGPVYANELVHRGEPKVVGLALVEEVEARGGTAFLVVKRGACAPSILPLRLPGYLKRNGPLGMLHVRVPTCQASQTDMISIPAGEFVFGGVGVPPSSDVARDPEARVERRIRLDAFRIDRTEVTNAAFEQLSAMESITDIAPPLYPASPDLGEAAAPNRPVTGIDWIEARAYCRFVGKELPTQQQWTRVQRGGLVLPDGTPNPAPTRNFPWGTDPRPGAAKLLHVGAPGVAVAGTFPQDRSPEGVVDLAGNVSEWVDGVTRQGLRVVRGGNVWDADESELVEYVAIENSRPARMRHFAIGVRCAAR